MADLAITIYRGSVTWDRFSEHTDTDIKSLRRVLVRYLESKHWGKSRWGEFSLVTFAPNRIEVRA
jgi:hypothetical protein